MVAKRAWIPSKGTYSVGESSEPFNPTMGDLFHQPQSPFEISSQSEKISPTPYDQLLQNNANLTEFLNVASLANLADVHESDGEWKARGDPTECAIQVFASRFDWNRHGQIDGEKPHWQQLAEFPFDSDVKKMSVILQDTAKNQNHVFTKGAVERIIGSCSKVFWEESDEPVEMTDDMRKKILENMEAIASLGLRCLAFASRPFDGQVKAQKEMDRDAIENNLIFRGLIGLYDPPRPESAGAVQKCHEAGIAVHMLTGDHAGTARAIAQQVGILPQNTKQLSKDVVDAMVMTAAEFDGLSDEQIDNLPVLPLVVARCAPNTKVRMIEALHRRKRFCAMTGDGVNDSPSLKRADVGIAMGEAGSDVAKDASDIILTDDNFASILNAIEEGRRMFDNIQKFVLHLLAQNIAQACVLLIGLAFKDSYGISVFPLSPVEILWIIMVTSAWPDMGLGFERAQSDIMVRPPISLKKGIFTYEVLMDMVVYGLWTAALCLGAFSLVLDGFNDGYIGTGCNASYDDCDLVFRARGTAFACLTWFSLFLAWEMLHMRRSFFRMQPKSRRYLTQWMMDVWRNKFLFWSVVAGFVTMFPLLYIPVINHDVFLHEGISWEWGVVFIAAGLHFAGIETWKWGKRVFFRRLDAHRAKKAKGSESGPGTDQGRLEDAFASPIKRAESDESEGDPEKGGKG